jgi:hypothetical protein
MGPFANLGDVMLVFAVGLMVVMAALGGGLKPASGGAGIEPGREIPDPPAGTGEAGSGFESMGQVYRDPETGRMILIGE